MRVSEADSQESLPRGRRQNLGAGHCLYRSWHDAGVHAPPAGHERGNIHPNAHPNPSLRPSRCSCCRCEKTAPKQHEREMTRRVAVDAKRWHRHSFWPDHRVQRCQEHRHVTYDCAGHNKPWTLMAMVLKAVHTAQHHHEDGDNHCKIPGTSIDVGRHHPPAQVTARLQESLNGWQGGGPPAQCDCCRGCNVISAEDAGEKVVIIKPGVNMTKTCWPSPDMPWRCCRRNGERPYALDSIKRSYRVNSTWLQQRSSVDKQSRIRQQAVKASRDGRGTASSRLLMWHATNASSGSSCSWRACAGLWVRSVTDRRPGGSAGLSADVLHNPVANTGLCSTAFQRARDAARWRLCWCDRRAGMNDRATASCAFDKHFDSRPSTTRLLANLCAPATLPGGDLRGMQWTREPASLIPFDWYIGTYFELWMIGLNWRQVIEITLILNDNVSDNITMALVLCYISLIRWNSSTGMGTYTEGT